MSLENLIAGATDRNIIPVGQEFKTKISSKQHYFYLQRQMRLIENNTLAKLIYC